MKTNLSMLVIALFAFNMGCQKSDDNKSSPTENNGATSNTSATTPVAIKDSICGIKVSKNTGVYGTWLSPKFTNIPVDDGTRTLTLYFVIDNEKSSAVGVCKNSKTNMEACAVATSSAKIDETASTIDILGNDSNNSENKAGDIKCSASISSGLMKYSISGDTLTFLDEKEGNLELKRQ